MTLLLFYAKVLRQILAFLPFVRLFLFYVWYYTGGLCRICEWVLAKSESFYKICGKKQAVQPVIEAKTQPAAKPAVFVCFIAGLFCMPHFKIVSLQL